MIDIEQLTTLEKARAHRVMLVACEYHTVVHLGDCVGPLASLSDLEYVAAAAGALPDLLVLLEEARGLIGGPGGLLEHIGHHCDTTEQARAFLAKFQPKREAAK